ncbi:uncharacterized protein RCC_02581 [Ramularia collo-cygni]|uniref:Stress-response A/B barrel domain-containing protein n=1 Tax=Ramularia collo-cygni TaxID=112498 RepID=A0A2D3UZQ9_9PEZI|nr:uncharacterized protein RCC_02581 [Ramularia collo-cygni]CZT16746.1 uncharacterized protein RCC_02581 [Ramularia collo-cygni]
MFKIPKEEDIEAVLKDSQDGEKYIVSNVARRVLNTTSPLSEGFTIASQSVFKSREDHDFYDQECPAHKELKKTTSKTATGKMTLVTEGDWPEPEL